MHVGGPSNTRFGQKYHYTASTTEVEDPDSLMHTLEARSGFKADVSRLIVYLSAKQIAHLTS